MRKAIFALDPAKFSLIYGEEERADIARLVSVDPHPYRKEELRADPRPLEGVEIVFSGWDAPCFDAELLSHAPALKIVLYGAGSVRRVVTPAFWDRGLRISSAYAANAVPVAEYVLSQILFCLKQGYRLSREVREARRFVAKENLAGAYRSTVGLVSLGMIGRKVAALLRHFDVKTIAYARHTTPADAEALGVELCPLDDVFRRSDVVSLHTPWLPETEGMVLGRHFRSMKPYAAFINSARGAVVREEEMVAVLRERPDIQAVLDVTYPEPPVPDSPLYTLPNVVLTPHLAGSVGPECRRMGRCMVEELERYLAGEPLRCELSREKAELLA